MNKFIISYLLLVIFSGCGLSDEEVLRMATEEFERKSALLRQEQLYFCQKAALAEAEKQADSIISEMRISPLHESLYRPVVPPKPSFISTDSTRLFSKDSVKPILDSNRIKG